MNMAELCGIIIPEVDEKAEIFEASRLEAIERLEPELIGDRLMKHS